MRRRPYSRLPRTSRCGKSRASWNTQPTARSSAGTLMSLAVSSSTSPSSSMRPRAGVDNPDRTETSVDLPAPDRPKRAVTPGVGAENSTSSEKSPRSRLHENSSMSGAQAAAHAARQPFGQQQADKPQRYGQRRDPQRRSVAVGGLDRGVQRERQGARLARNIGHESDDGAEFTETR